MNKRSLGLLYISGIIDASLIHNLVEGLENQLQPNIIVHVDGCFRGLRIWRGPEIEDGKIWKASKSFIS